MRTINLCMGRGTEGVSHCVMAATSIVNGEAFSDDPQCTCPTIRKALMRVNDSCPTDAIRNRLLGHLPWIIIGTRSEGLSIPVKRAKLFAEYATHAAAASTSDAATDAATYATAVAATCVTDAATYSAAAVDHLSHTAIGNDAWEKSMKKFIDFIEQVIVPVYSTTPIEPGCNIDKLVTEEV